MKRASAPVKAALDLLDAMEQLFSEAQAEAERRVELRLPFFRPVWIDALHEGEPRRFSAFSRDLSPMGIGLLHNMPLELDVVTLTIPIEDGDVLRFDFAVKWCRPCGEGWYISGGLFLRLDA